MMSADVRDAIAQIGEVVASYLESSMDPSTPIVEHHDHTELERLLEIPDYIAAGVDDPEGAYNEYNLQPYIDLNENNSESVHRPASSALWDYLERNAAEFPTPDGEPF